MSAGRVPGTLDRQALKSWGEGADRCWFWGPSEVCPWLPAPAGRHPSVLLEVWCPPRGSWAGCPPSAEYRPPRGRPPPRGWDPSSSQPVPGVRKPAQRVQGWGSCPGVAGASQAWSGGPLPSPPGLWLPRPRVSPLGLPPRALALLPQAPQPQPAADPSTAGHLWYPGPAAQALGPWTQVFLRP